MIDRAVVLQEYQDRLGKEVFGFFNEHRFLSNFHIAPLVYRGLTFPTSEHAYMAMKSTDKEWWQYMAGLQTPREARAEGQRVELRPDWAHVKVKFMYEVCFNKFTQNEDLREKLLSPKDQLLTENNWWRDTFWGFYKGTGENNLGKVLMKVRSEMA